MSNEKFKVKFGLAVGDTAATVDGTTGDVATIGQYTSTQANNTADGEGQIFLNGANGNRVDWNTNGLGAPAFTTRSTGTKAVLYPSIGASSVDYALGVEAGGLWSSVPGFDAGQLFKWYGGTTQVASLSGTGNLILAGTLDVQGGTITDSTGALSITTGASNGAITLDPNGTGNVVCTFSNGGNLTNDRNYVHGSIRNATTRDTNGDIWELNTSGAQSATNPYFRGLSLSNSSDTTRGPGTLMRSYSGGAVSGSASRGRVIFEKARGFPEGVSTGPSAVQSADVLGSIDATGYTSTGWLNDTIPAVAGTTTFAATENWVSNTNLGTQFNVALAPSATTISSGANLIAVLAINPQTAAHRSDATTFSQGKSGSTTYATLGLTGNTITALNAANVFIRQGSTNTTAPALTIRYQRTDQTGSSDLDGVDFRLSTGGTTTTNNIARFEAQYRTSGIHEVGISVSSDSFAADADTIYLAKADKTIIRATPAGTTGTASNIMEITDANILNNRAHRNAITTGTVARGGTYSVPATANGSISLTITAGTGITYIDVDAVAADAGTGGMYSVLIYNNSGDNNIDVQVRNNGANIGLSNNLDIGHRAMASIYVVGDYAACEIMDAA